VQAEAAASVRAAKRARAEEGGESLQQGAPAGDGEGAALGVDVARGATESAADEQQAGNGNGDDDGDAASAAPAPTPAPASTSFATDRLAARFASVTGRIAAATAQ
jgi:hypothetical protein